MAVTAAGGGAELDSLKKTQADIQSKLAELDEVSKTQSEASKRRMDALKADTNEGAVQSFERLEEQISDLENTPMSAADKAKAFRELQRNIDAAAERGRRATIGAAEERRRSSAISCASTGSGEAGHVPHLESLAANRGGSPQLR